MPEVVRKRRLIAETEKVKEAIQKLYEKLKEYLRNKRPDDIVLVGIKTRGAILVERLQKRLIEEGLEVRFGFLDITLYRDDIYKKDVYPQIKPSFIPVAIEDKEVILIDDVIFTGRTVRAALEELLSYGRPKCIRLYVLIDRGGRELPIQPDFCVIELKNIKEEEFVRLKLEEVDKEECIIVL